MNVQLSLQNPGHLSNNNIFNFPHGLEYFDYTVIANVISETVNGLGHDDSNPVDILGLTPLVDETNIIWSNRETDEQADIDGILTIEITDVVVEEDNDVEIEEPEDDILHMGEDYEDGDSDTRSQAHFMENDEGYDSDFDESDEAIAMAEAEERDDALRRVNELRLNVENDLKSELVGAKLNLEFTAGVLVRWELV